MRVQRCKGSRDLSREEMRRFRLIEEAFRECCLKAGYEEVKTPTVEYLHLFTAAGTLTPSRLSRAYSFLDWDGWSGERVVLRPDGTIPIARFYVETRPDNGLAKLFYITNVFVFEPTGAKAREQWQCGAELIGAGSPLADVELITLAKEVLHKLGLKDAELKLSHVGLIRALLEELGVGHSEQTKLFDRILDGDLEALTRLKPKHPELGRALSSLLKLKGKSSAFLQNFKALFVPEMAKLEPHIDDLIKVVSLLDTLGDNYEIDIAAGTGFEYYSGMAFELFLGEDKIGGGGRYDALVPLLGGPNVPASGFALYLDRLMERLSPVTGAKPAAQRVLIRPESSEPESIRESFKLAGRLREAGYVAELDLGAQTPTKFDWVAEIKASAFVLTNQANNRRFELSTQAEVLALLEIEDATKARPT